MSSESSVRVTILGKEYPLMVEESNADTLKLIAHFVDSEMVKYKRAKPAWDCERVAVVAALSIAGDLFEIKEKYEAEVKKVQECEEKIKSINEMVRNADKKVG